MINNIADYVSQSFLINVHFYFFEGNEASLSFSVAIIHENVHHNYVNLEKV